MKVLSDFSFLLFPQLCALNSPACSTETAPSGSVRQEGTMTPRDSKFINHPLAATSRETTRCAHSATVGQICQKRDTRAGTSFLSPMPHCMQKRDGCTPTAEAARARRIPARPPNSHAHHKDQLQLQ